MPTEKTNNDTALPYTVLGCRFIRSQRVHINPIYYIRALVSFADIHPAILLATYGIFAVPAPQYIYVFFPYSVEIELL